MITPMDIHNKTFSRKIRGYAEEEVNSFLEEVVSDYERIYREHREMEEQMDAIKTKLQNYEKMETTMSSTLVMAQETAESVKGNAHKEADLILRETQNERTRILAATEEEIRRTKAAILKMETDMHLYTEKTMNSLRAAMAMVKSVQDDPMPSMMAKEADDADLQTQKPVELAPVQEPAAAPAEQPEEEEKTEEKTEE